ncbi:hypothetical protein ACU686_21660 [Yinghuangia aomiensis]
MLVGACRGAVGDPAFQAVTGDGVRRPGQVPAARSDVMWSIMEHRDGPASPDKVALQRPGAWFTDKTVVVAEAARLVSYNQETGKTEWEYPAPDGAQVCDVTPQTDTPWPWPRLARTASASSLVAVDLKTGKKVWSVDTGTDPDDPRPLGLQPDPGHRGHEQHRGLQRQGLWRVRRQAAVGLGDRLAEGMHRSGVPGGKRLVAKWTCGYQGRPRSPKSTRRPASRSGPIRRRRRPPWTTSRSPRWIRSW